MNEFDQKALIWDNNPQRIEMIGMIVEHMKKNIPFSKNFNAFEYGAGTGLLSVMLSSEFNHILTADTSEGMLNVLNTKIIEDKINNIKALNLDLTRSEPPAEKFDLIYSSMTLHHIKDISGIFKTFSSMLKQNGYLVLVDLIKEDGSFHGAGFDGHNGFDLQELQKLLVKEKFNILYEKTIFNMKKTTSENILKEYPIFMMIAQK